MSGPLFGGIAGFLLSHTCAVSGACVCYMISRTLGAGFVQKRMPNKVAWLQRKIKENRHNLLYYFMFLRLTPLVPNWFLNASSGTVGVPFSIFVGATTLGLIPYTIMLVRTGLMLDSITTIGFDASVSSPLSTLNFRIVFDLEHRDTLWTRLHRPVAHLPNQERRHARRGYR